MSQEACQGTRADGTPCHSWALPDSPYCFAHDPAMHDKRQAAVVKGGKGRATTARVERLLPKDLKPILALLLQGMEEVHDGTLSPQQYSAMSSGAAAISRLYGVVQLEDAVAALEARINAQGREGHGYGSGDGHRHGHGQGGDHVG